MTRQLAMEGGKLMIDRLARPGDIGWLAVYLGSDESRCVTGADFSIDGGATAAPFIIGTDRVTLMHVWLVKVFCRMMPQHRMPSPIPFPPIRECLQWNRETDSDECLLWVRRQLISAPKMDMAA